MLHAQWPQCVTHGVQISTVGAPDRHTGSPYCLPHKTERKTEHLRAALLAPSSTKLPTHLFPLSFLWPSTSNIKRGENNGTLKAMSHCLQKEHIWIALHIEIYLKKKKMLHRLSFYAPSIQISSLEFSDLYENLAHLCLPKGKGRNLPKLKFSIFKSAHSLTSIC